MLLSVQLTCQQCSPTAEPRLYDQPSYYSIFCQQLLNSSPSPRREHQFCGDLFLQGGSSPCIHIRFSSSRCSESTAKPSLAVDGKPSWLLWRKEEFNFQWSKGIHTDNLRSQVHASSSVIALLRIYVCEDQLSLSFIVWGASRVCDHYTTQYAPLCLQIVPIGSQNNASSFNCALEKNASLSWGDACGGPLMLGMALPSAALQDVTGRPNAASNILWVAQLRMWGCSNISCCLCMVHKFLKMSHAHGKTICDCVAKGLPNMLRQIDKLDMYNV